MSIKEIIDSFIATSVPDNEVALHLSGGVDSCCVGFSATSLGKKVVAYSFRMKNSPSPDSKSAEHISSEMGWEFNLIELPNDLETLISDVKKLNSNLSCTKKTQYECTWPFVYIFPEIKEKYVLSGIAADGHYGLSRSSHTKFQVRKSKDNFDKFRFNYFSQENIAGYLQQIKLAELHNKIFVAPFLHASIFEYFIQFDWHQINKPFEKHQVIKEYPREFSLMKIRKHANLQLISGVSDHFEILLNSNLNTRNRIRVMDILRDVSVKHSKESQLSFL